MTFEQLIGETLHAADDYAPSDDLFAKVQRSIVEDQAHRRRVTKVLLALATAAAGLAVYLVVTVSVTDGEVTMPFGALELLVTLMMVGIVVAMGPAIRRFGETYEQTVFAGSPEAGAQALRLLDVAYYLIFGAYIVMTLLFEQPTPDFVLGQTLTPSIFWYGVLTEVQRLAGLLLLMGVLHVTLVVSLPVIGLVHAANQRRARIAHGAESSDPLAVKADRGVTIGVWIVAGVVLFQLLSGVLGLIVLLGAGG